MIRNRHVCLVCLAIFAAAFSPRSHTAQTDSESFGKRIIQIENQKSDIQPNLEHLCTAIGARLTGSPQLKKANEWAANRMREYGLQDVKLEPFQVPVGWERGVCSLRMTAPYPMAISAAQAAWTQGTTGAFTAPLILYSPKTEAELNGFRGRLKGAIVIAQDSVPVPKPDGYEYWTEAAPSPRIPALQADSDGTPARAPAPAVARRAQSLLREEPPVAVLVDAGKPHGLLNMWGGWGVQKQVYPTLIVANHHLAHLVRLLKRGIAVQLEVNAKSRFVSGPLTSHSTIGEIPGSDLKDETVLVGAHIDSWDLGTGATDNGTGVVTVLEAARLISASGFKPRRTVRFGLFGGEEQSFGGSLAYIRNRKPEIERMSAAFIHDSGTGQVKGTSLENRGECGPILTRQFDLAKQLGLMAEDPVIRPGRDPGSDHDAFNQAGVPAFAFFQDPAEYGLTHHTNADTLEYIRYPDLKQGALIMALIAYDTAQMDSRFPRKE